MAFEKTKAVFLFVLILFIYGCNQQNDKVESFDGISTGKTVEDQMVEAEPNSVEQIEFVSPEVVDINVSESVSQVSEDLLEAEPDFNTAPDANILEAGLIESAVEIIEKSPENIVEPVDIASVNEPNEASGEKDLLVDEPNEIGVDFHQKCAGLLRSYVNEKGEVDYSALRRRRLELNGVLDEFANMGREEYESWGEWDKMAFWINAYNVQMLNVIVKNYPIESSRVMRFIWSPDSIKHIKGIWTDYKFIVMDEEFTLKDVEVDFFGKEFNDPRLFFALNQGSQSGPLLRMEPYEGSQLDEQLEEQVKNFLSREENFRIDKDGKMVYLSSLFKPAWYGKYFARKYSIDRKFKDFSADERAVINFLTNYVSEDEVNFLEVENYKIEYVNYDWRLNDF
ncbi:MAG: DUF547 domain-containing protein [Planctomycetes bacterium]|nr:DUF547 domain-containing protein [Planctomycetota bacterium]